MRLLAGTSGFSYAEWKGPFYPERLAPAAMLGWYAERLPSVEINNTFYRMPRAALLEGWAARVPEDFRFALKASRRITHHARLRGADEAVAYLFRAAEALGPRLGCVLFQLPPDLRCDVARLRDFLTGLPPGRRAAFEFRHPSWECDAVHEALREANAALCTAEHEGGPPRAPLVATADWGYLRLRGPDYGDEALRAWLDAAREPAWNEVFAFFKHEAAGAAPRLAGRLLALADAAPRRGPRRAERPRRAPAKVAAARRAGDGEDVSSG